MSFDWSKGFTADFDLVTGLSESVVSTKRHLSKMKGMYLDSEAETKMIANDDPMIYEFHEMGAPEDAGDIAPGTSITYPGKVGDEYFFTKGHFHTIINTAEVYYTLSGRGYMMMENPEGEWNACLLEPGKIVYVPPRFAHRSINIGNTPLVTFFAFRGDAGHDYGSIEVKGFRKLVVERGGKAEIIDNPRWK